MLPTLFKILAVGAIVLIFVIAIILASILVRWPTMSQLRNAVGKALLYNEEVARALSHNEKAAGIVGETFTRDYKTNAPTSVPNVPHATVKILSPTKATKAGHGVAQISGLAQSASYVSGSADHTLLPNTPPCSGTISFDYQFYWNDNGRSRRWDCAISNIVVINSPAK